MSANLSELSVKENALKNLILLAMLSLSFALVGCNTMKGFGEDLQKAGEKIEGAAKK